MLMRRGALVRGWIRRARRRLSSGRFVFVYHRVADPEHDPWGLAVAPDRFAEQLQVMRAYGQVVPLDRMLHGLRDGTLPERAVAVTFDDGYADTFLAAKPLLSRHEVPATVYLCPALLDGRSSFWWDSLTRIVFGPETLPTGLEMWIGDEMIRWQARDTGTTGGPTGRGGASFDDPSRRSTSDALRWALYQNLWAALRRLSRELQRPVLAELSVWAGGAALDDPRERPLTTDEATRLAADPLVEIGAHTLTHASLPACSHEQRKAEIEGSKSACEDIAGARVNSFSYPYGDHDARTVTSVRAAGFSSACTTAPWALGRRADPLRLPRIPARDWDGAQMERRLATADFD